MKYNFDQVIDRRSSDSIKWKHYASDVIPMWVADMDFPSPEPVIQALRERAEHGFFGYPDASSPFPDQALELRDTIVDWVAARHGWSIRPEWLVFVPGVVTGFNLAGARVQADEAVLVQTPVYPPILNSSKDVGIQGQEMELNRTADGTYAVDWDAFEAAFTPTTRLFLLCNPHNPIGKVFNAGELTRLAEICLRRKVTIVSDEIHADLVFSENRHIPMAALDPEIADRTITLMAPSKTFNLAGLQCSFAVVSNPELRKWYTRGMFPWVNLFGLAGAQAAYRYGGEWLDQLLPYLQTNRDNLVSFVRRYMPNIHIDYPQGTYLAWLDCRQSGIEGSPYRFFLDKARVALSDGAGFGKGGEGFVRLNFGCPRPLLEEGLERMRAALNELN